MENVDERIMTLYKIMKNEMDLGGPKFLFGIVTAKESLLSSYQANSPGDLDTLCADASISYTCSDGIDPPHYKSVFNSCRINVEKILKDYFEKNVKVIVMHSFVNSLNLNLTQYKHNHDDNVLLFEDDLLKLMKNSRAQLARCTDPTILNFKYNLKTDFNEYMTALNTNDITTWNSDNQARRLVRDSLIDGLCTRRFKRMNSYQVT